LKDGNFTYDKQCDILKVNFGSLRVTQGQIENAQSANTSVYSNYGLN